MLSKRQKLMAEQSVRATALERLRKLGVPVRADARAKNSYIAKLIHEYAGLPHTENPMDSIRAFAMEREVGAVPSREINAMRQPELRYQPAFMVSAIRARAAQPPMMSMCGMREGWGG